MGDAARYLVVRVPSPGPPALVAPPYDFATRAEAEERVAAVEARQRKAHHTHVEIVRYDGSLTEELSARGILP